MRYCKYCGAELKENSRFCTSCGQPVDSSEENPKWRYRAQRYGESIKTESADKLGCELAYTGFLFWLPLIQMKHPKAKYCANQGLWSLLTATGACWMIQLLGVVRDLFAGSVLGIPVGAVYSLIFALFLIFMAYLTYSCLKNAVAVHHGEQPTDILFFEKKAIIKEA